MKLKIPKITVDNVLTVIFFAGLIIAGLALLVFGYTLLADLFEYNMILGVMASGVLLSLIAFLLSVLSSKTK